MALSICANLGQQLDGISFRTALTGMAIDLAHYWQHPIQRSNPNLDVFFSTPMDELPEFEGMRLHSYEADSNTLKIELVIPQQIMRSSYAKSYVIAAMQDAVDAADEFFKQQHISFNKDDYLLLINKLSNGKNQLLH